MTRRARWAVRLSQALSGLAAVLEATQGGLTTEELERLERDLAIAALEVESAKVSADAPELICRAGAWIRSGASSELALSTLRGMKR